MFFKKFTQLTKKFTRPPVALVAPNINSAEEYHIDGNQNNPDFVDRNYDDEEKDNHKKRRRSYVAAGSVENTGSLPEHYRHVRKSIHGVRPEVYTALDRYFKRETCPERNIYPSCSCHGRYIYKYNV